MLGRDIQIVFAAVDVSILDLRVRELHVPIPVRQVVLTGPLLDFAGLAIRPSVGVRPATIALVQPLLVLRLQFVVQPHALNLQAPLLELRRVTLVGAMDLGVVFQFALALKPRVAGLARITVTVAIRLQEIAATVRQHHRLLPIAWDANGLDQSLLAEVPKVAIPGIGWSVIAVAEVEGRDDPKGAHGREGPALRTAQGVLTVTRVVDDLMVAATGQIETAREHVASTTLAVPVSVAGVSLSVVPAHVVAITMVRTPFVTVASFIVVLGHVVRTGAASDRQRIVMVPVTFVSLSRVSLVAVITRIEVHNTSRP